MVLTRASDAEADDPVLGQFLGFLAHDIATHPERLQSVSSSFVQRVQSLVSGKIVGLPTSKPVSSSPTRRLRKLSLRVLHGGGKL